MTTNTFLSSFYVLLAYLSGLAISLGTLKGFYRVFIYLGRPFGEELGRYGSYAFLVFLAIILGASVIILGILNALFGGVIATVSKESIVRHDGSSTYERTDYSASVAAQPLIRQDSSSLKHINYTASAAAQPVVRQGGSSSLRRIDYAPSVVAQPIVCQVCWDHLSETAVAPRNISNSCCHQTRICQICARSAIRAQIGDIRWRSITCPLCPQVVPVQRLGIFLDASEFNVYVSSMYIEHAYQRRLLM